LSRRPEIKEGKQLTFAKNKLKQGQNGKPTGALGIETRWGESNLGSFWASDVEKTKHRGFGVVARPFARKKCFNNTEEKYFVYTYGSK